MSIRISRRVTGQATAVARLVLVGLVCGPLCKADAAPGQPSSPPPSLDRAATQRLLLDGVRAFRGERYEEALNIFQRVEAADPSSDIGFYLGMTQHKLGRHLEALSALRAARRRGLREPVADYYQAVSCYRLGMFERARQSFAALSASFRGNADAPVLGPRLQQGAQRFIQALEAARATPEPEGKRQGLLLRYEAARTQADQQLSGGSAAAALEWLDEAVGILAQVPDRAEKLPALRKSLLRLREALRGQPAEPEIAAQWSRVSGGPI
jgi:tetratricopeptide (TPR) repeat protein